MTAGLRNAEAIVADASVHPFAPDSFELAFSRFGIMFFSDPVAAFENVRRAMKPGGRLALLPSLSAAERENVRASLEVYFRGHAASQGVVLPAEIWVVRARV
jgi:ubiquinone/menaquinone biosynthesis C-methylase UbiE